ncbi:polysaccharide deacetylase family protein [Castellaniella sp.]|uniref:polysaccharide deacetylase family protein n=1 Tax=Castellaniella sp. TaxID=1955812 RepID=UPI00356628CE
MTREPIVPVLMYHHVTPAGGDINVTPAHFRDQLQWLQAHGYRSLTCHQFADHLAGRKPAPRRSILITFDDGYLDNYVHAWPLLKAFGFHGVIFLVTGWVGEGAPRAHAGTSGPVPYTPTHAEFKRLRAQGDTDAFALRWSEIERMRASGVCEFHSHTHTHTRWDLLEGDKNAHMREELAQSRASLQARLGEVSDHLCWPQGYFDADYVRIAQEAGFRHLYTTRAFGRNRPGSDPTMIFRFAVRNTTGASVGRRIRVAASPWMAPVFNGWKRFKRGDRYPG